MTSSQTPLLPTEVAALVQHIELHRSGWWDKTIERLVLAAVWLSGDAPTDRVVRHTLGEQLGLSLGEGKLSAALAALERQDLLVRSNEGLYRIPDKARSIFEGEIKEAERIHGAAREVFTALVHKHCPALRPADVWVLCESHLLGPLVEGAGASAYRLIAGESLATNGDLVAGFLDRFAEESRDGLRDALAAFLDPKNKDVTAHVSRMLHARFCVEAGGLPDAIIKKLVAAVGGQVKLRLFVDTNFLFSILDLHENPSNAAARELQGLIRQVKSNLKIELVIMPRTIEEAKTSITAAKAALVGIPSGSNFTLAALRVGFSGMVDRFFNERLARSGRLSPEDWFEPYLRDFLAMSRGKGVELFNRNVDDYALRQDVTDDILSVLDYEMRRPEGRRKSYQKVAHDMILWHFVQDQRAAYVESPLDVQDWLLTIDFRLIGFDEFKRKQSRQPVPVCVHPVSLIQLLQFWVPRSAAFEEAMLGSLRLPFLFREFDVEAERTSLRILKGLGRFEGRDDIPEQTLTRVILNEGLRSRIQAEQLEDVEGDVALIRDALVAEANARAEAEAEKAKALETKLNDTVTALASSDASTRVKESEVEKLKLDIAAEQARSEAARGKLQDTAQRLAENERKVQEQSSALAKLTESSELERAARERQTAITIYAGWLLCVILSTVGAAWLARHYLTAFANIVGLAPLVGLAALLVFLGGHLILEWRVPPGSTISRLWPFTQMRRFRKWLWTIVVLAFLLGVGGNIYANWIQHNLDAGQHNLPPQPSGAPGSGVKPDDR
jgi:hypothetical protein